MPDVSLKELQNRLQHFAAERDWEKFHTPKNLAMALIVEAAELVEQFQWLSAEESISLEPQKQQQVAMELADIFLYLLRIADKLDIDLLDAAQKKIAVNEAKYPASLVYGSAKKYDEY